MQADRPTATWVAGASGIPAGIPAAAPSPPLLHYQNLHGGSSLSNTANQEILEPARVQVFSSHRYAIEFRPPGLLLDVCAREPQRLHIGMGHFPGPQDYKYAPLPRPAFFL